MNKEILFRGKRVDNYLRFQLDELKGDKND